MRFVWKRPEIRARFWAFLGPSKKDWFCCILQFASFLHFWSSCVILPGKRSFKGQLIEVMQQGIEPHEVC